MDYRLKYTTKTLSIYRRKIQEKVFGLGKVVLYVINVMIF